MGEMIKTWHELFEMGGKFYTIGDESWCDTAIHSWRHEPGIGYVAYEPNGGAEGDVARHLPPPHVGGA